MKTVLANLWHALGGVTITDIEEKRFLFRFYCEAKITRVVKGSPWTFNSHLLFIETLSNSVDPLETPLLKARFWVQIHNLPAGFYSELMAKQFGVFIREFMEYDAKFVATGLKNFIKIRVMVDIRQPLKRK